MTSPDIGDAGDRLESAGEADLQAIEQLFRESLNPLTRFVYSYVKSWEAAEDIVHNVFLQLWLRRRSLEPVRDLAAYLYTIARYDALDYLRHQGIEARHRQEPQDVRVFKRRYCEKNHRNRETGRTGFARVWKRQSRAETPQA